MHKSLSSSCLGVSIRNGAIAPLSVMQRSVKAQLYRALTLQPRTTQTSIYKYTTSSLH